MPSHRCSLCALSSGTIPSRGIVGPQSTSRTSSLPEAGRVCNGVLEGIQPPRNWERAFVRILTTTHSLNLNHHRPNLHSWPCFAPRPVFPSPCVEYSFGTLSARDLTLTTQARKLPEGSGRARTGYGTSTKHYTEQQQAYY